MSWHDIASLLCIVLAGIFDGLATDKRDGVATKIDTFIFKHPKFYAWYNGGVYEYDPGSIFAADYWHDLKFLIIYSYCACAAFQVWKYNGFWWASLFWFVCQGLEGTVFKAVYHYLAPQKPLGDFKHFISSFNPFKNFHVIK